MTNEPTHGLSLKSFGAPLLAALAIGLAPAAARAEAPISTVVLNTYFQNDHAEWVPTSEAERKRMSAMVDTFKSMLEKSGKYSFKPVDPAIQKRIAQDQKMGECAGCETRYGKELDVDQVAWIEVQKVSELILNVNVYMTDVKTGKQVFVKSVDLRGNNDESWQHSIKFLVKRYMLHPEQYTQPAGKS
jgi:hypothetical protein